MPPSDYDLFRQRLDEQLRARLKIVYESYLVEVRASEILALAQGAAGAGLLPPLALSAALGDVEPARQLPAAGPPDPAPPSAAAASSESSIPAPPVPPAPAAAPPPAPPARQRSGGFEVHNAVLDALPQLGDEAFDSEALVRLLPFRPRRSTLYGVLHELVYTDKVLELVQRGSKGAPSRYRKRKPGSGPPAQG